jgi:hypothetical protein
MLNTSTDLVPMKRSIQIALPSFGEEEWQALREPLTSGWVTQGPKVAAFERAFAARHGVERALATTSCTTGLHLILAALGVGPGDEVIVPSFTWVATANAVVYCGATPVIADVNRTTFNIDPADVARRITGKTRTVIAVHLFGLCADMDALRAVCPLMWRSSKTRPVRLERATRAYRRAASGLRLPSRFIHASLSRLAKAAWSQPIMLLSPIAWTDCVIMEPQYPRSSVTKAPGLICCLSSIC